MQILIKLFQISADWLLMTFTTVQAITELRSYKRELKTIEDHEGRLYIDGYFWWVLFPYKIYLEKRKLKTIQSKLISSKEVSQLKRIKSFLNRAGAWLYIVLGSSFYLISTTIDILTSILRVPRFLVYIFPLCLVISAILVANEYMKHS